MYHVLQLITMYSFMNGSEYSAMNLGYGFYLESFGCYYGAVQAPSWQPIMVFPQQDLCNRLQQIPDTQKQIQKTKENSEFNSREPRKSGKTMSKHLKQKKRIEKDSQYKIKGQNMKRNIFSNITRHMINYVRNRKAVLPKVRAIISVLSLSVTPDRFFQFADSIILNNYIRAQTMKQLWFKLGQKEGVSTKAEDQNSKILRIICLEFLRCNAHLAVQLAKKIRPNYKTDHHKKIREIIQILSDPMK